MYEAWSIIGVIHLVLVVWTVWDLLISGRSCCSVGCWILFLLFFPVLGPIIYLISFRQPRVRQG